MGTSIGDINGKWAALFKVSLAAAPLVVTITLGLVTWIHTELGDVSDAMSTIDKRVVVIEASRFTAADGAALSAAVAARPTRSEVPPPEVTQRLARIEDDIATLNTKVDRLLMNGGHQ